MKRKADEQAQVSESKRIHPFFTQESQPMSQPLRWIQQIPSVLIGRSKQADPGRDKVAAFDLVIISVSPQAPLSQQLTT